MTSTSIVLLHVRLGSSGAVNGTITAFSPTPGKSPTSDPPLTADGRLVLLLKRKLGRFAVSGILSLPWSPFASLPPDVDVPLLSRYAQMNFMTLPDRKRRSGGGGFKSRLLGGIFGLDVSVMENAPLIFAGDDCILRQTHLQLPLHPSSRTSSPVGPFLS